MKNYTHYRVEDFILDDCFRDWVLNKSTEGDSFWQEWISNHLEKKPVIQEAREILLALQPDQPQITSSEMEEGFQEISAIYKKIMGRHKKRLHRRCLWIAIAGVILALAGWYLFHPFPQKQQIKKHSTKEGQQMSIELPDGSLVTMSEQSRLSYSSNWEKVKDRKVKLRGEAFFQVTENLYQNVRTRFLVTTPDLSIEVIGTDFMVRQRKSKTRVWLESGMILIQINRRDQQIIMAPGDVVEYDAVTHQLTNSRKGTSSREPPGKYKEITNPKP